VHIYFLERGAFSTKTTQQLGSRQSTLIIRVGREISKESN